jgi:uncharacterized protein Yka (UPF0111/DUF47 family)
MVDLLVMATGELQRAVNELRTLKKSNAIHEHLLELNRLENEGDAVFRGAVARLFQEEKDAIRLLVWKEVYEISEEALDRCEGVGHIIEAVVLKHG